MNPKSTQKPGAVGKSSEEPAALGGNEKQAEANFKDDSMDHQVFQKALSTRSGIPLDKSKDSAPIGQSDKIAHGKAATIATSAPDNKVKTSKANEAAPANTETLPEAKPAIDASKWKDPYDSGSDTSDDDEESDVEDFDDGDGYGTATKYGRL